MLLELLVQAACVSLFLPGGQGRVYPGRKKPASFAVERRRVGPHVCFSGFGSGCCPGWMLAPGSGQCTLPLCPFGCGSGFCIAPNLCSCPDGEQGITCPGRVPIPSQGRSECCGATGLGGERGRAPGVAPVPRGAPACLSEPPGTCGEYGCDLSCNHGGCQEVARVCPLGFSMVETANGIRCTDIDECLSAACEGLCVNTEGGFVCECGPGMQLSADRHSCQDTDECLATPCQHRCKNSVGSYRCSCRPGYHLHGNRHSCVGERCAPAPLRVATSPRLRGRGGRRHGAAATSSSLLGPCPRRWRSGRPRASCCGGFLSPCEPAPASCPGTDESSCSPDVNECRRPGDRRACQHACHNTPGSYLCSCRPGYRLSGDRVSCEGFPKSILAPSPILQSLQHPPTLVLLPPGPGGPLLLSPGGEGAPGTAVPAPRCWYRGALREPGTRWMEPGCRSCACQGGRVLCEAVSCPVPCSHPLPAPAGGCCPSCTGCLHEGVARAEGDVFSPSDGNCTVCVCLALLGWRTAVRGAGACLPMTSPGSALLRRLETSPASPPSAPRALAPAPRRLTAAPASQAAGGEGLWVALPGVGRGVVARQDRALLPLPALPSAPLSSPAKCSFRGRTYVHGARFSLDEDDCTTCVCRVGLGIPQQPVGSHSNLGDAAGGMGGPGTERLREVSPSLQGGEVECSFAPCPALDCPQHQRHLRPGQCCFTCRDPPRPSGCFVDDNGVEFPIGQIWSPGDPCELCICQADGSVSCKRTDCVETCPYPIHIPGQCCPDCSAGDGDRGGSGEAGVRLTPTASEPGGLQGCKPAVLPAGCTYMGQIFYNNETFPSLLDPCLSCICLLGSVACSPVDCAIFCTYPFHPEGECCPVCNGESGGGGHRTTAPTLPVPPRPALSAAAPSPAPLDCNYEGRKVVNGQTFSPEGQPCTRCTCQVSPRGTRGWLSPASFLFTLLLLLMPLQLGEVSCEERPCPRSCTEPPALPAACCPACQDTQLPLQSGDVSPSPSQSLSPSHKEPTGTPQPPRHRLAQLLLHAAPFGPSPGGEPPSTSPSPPQHRGGLSAAALPPAAPPAEATGPPAPTGSPGSRRDAEGHPGDAEPSAVPTAGRESSGGHAAP
ncbi:von Willebrand factor C and EGF domain-containing protein isoform B [Aix galericulata]|nr:von Willebrand factor C and EGF domain-containing protein isoform B [Aix galericulata]